MEQGVAVERAERAVELFRQGYACSQAVLLTWAPDFGLDENSLAQLSAPFAAGMRLDSTCGAVTGALMVIGLATCGDDCVTREGRMASVSPVLTFAKRFEELVGSTSCADIVGCDLRDPAALARANAEGLFATCCAPAVFAATQVLDEVIRSI
jgi:C_GCAxxG_C_C family probable redox protein